MKDCVLRLGWALGLVVALASGCDNASSGVAGDGGEDFSGAAEDLLSIAVDAGEDPDGGCAPMVTSCTNLCGAITDRCSGQTFQCGGCGAGTFCNPKTNMCEIPEKTCTDLQAECGFIRNSCNIRLNCGACTDPAKECDPDTNKCVACQNVSCIDLGYECGAAWLGCGPQTNLSNCGDCSAKPNTTCNPILHICEPKCTPMAKAVICAAAKTNGKDCGIITDNCGGVIDCGGCPAGEGCGIRGVANQCSPAEEPLECMQAGKNCGQIDSLCGGKVDCGTCPVGQVCNSNNVCGPACTPKDCTDPAYASGCGTQLDDGCLGKIPACVCTTAGQICSTVVPGAIGTCVGQNTCATYTANGQSGQACSVAATPTFPKGNGTNLNCPCTAAGAVCVNGTTAVTGTNTGTCCINDQVCAANECGTTKINKCTGATIVCGCTGNNFCDTTAKLCKPNIPCSFYSAGGAAGNPCSVNATVTFDKGGGVAQNCPCLGGRECISGSAPSPIVTGTSTGTCCQNTNPTCGTKCDGSTVTDSCTGAVTTCNGCAANNFCNAGTCMPFAGCPGGAAQGRPCSNGGAFDRGDGTLLTCKCPAGFQCYNGMVVVAGSTKGTCCQNTATCGTSCNTSVTNTCDGTAIPCNCNTANSFCNGTTCTPLKTCGQLTPPKTGLVGSPCSNNPAYDAGGGTLIACPCDTTGGKTNNQCVGGTCACVKDTCNGDCTKNGKSDGCGGTLNCACTAGQVCNPQTATCCSNYVCPSGVPGDECNIAHASCGSSVTCHCSGPAYNTCGGGGVANKCGCTPKMCPGNFTGTFDSGCGIISCGGG